MNALDTSRDMLGHQGYIWSEMVEEVKQNGLFRRINAAEAWV